MPSRKKAKLAHATGSETDTAHGADTPGSTAEYDALTDPWTDEQETALLKAIIKWKPVGLHKSFRMLAISDYLKSQGYAPSTAEHMRVPGIWKKLGTLYNLEALDERENAVILGENDDDDEAEADEEKGETNEENERYCPFELSYDEYGDMMFERRLAMEGSSSPATSRMADSRRGSTVADTDEPRSSPAPSRGRKASRGTRKATRETRSTKMQVEMGAEEQDKASDEEGDFEEEDENEEGEGDGDEESEGKDSEAEDEAGDERGSRSTRAKTSRSKPKDKKASTNAATRRTGRRR